MLLRSLQLENIRSYESASIRFDEGLTLLSGDIGSGKSTILLAIEFALFGLRRGDSRQGDISGTGLLRHGCKEGGVTLTFQCGPEVTVQQRLKRTKDSVVATDGYLEVNGKREELTTTQIKARVLELLGYPESEVSKAKSQMFRFTVYTPQEQMKQILTEDSSSRLQTLRGVFGIDKYQLAANNGKELGKRFRDELTLKQRELQGKKELEDQIAETIDAIEELESAVEKLQLLVDQKAAQVEATQSKFENLQTQKKEHDLKQQSITAKEEMHKRNLDELANITSDIKDISLDEIKVVKDPSEALDKISSTCLQLREKIVSGRTKLENYQEQLENLESEVERIAELDECPTCKQPVTKDHVKNMHSDLSEKREELESRIEKIEKLLALAKEKIEKAETSKHSLEVDKADYLEYKHKLQAKERDQQRLKRLEARQAELKKQIENYKPEKLKPFDDSSFNQLKQELQLLQAEHRKHELELASKRASLKEKGLQLQRSKEALDKYQALEKEISALSKKENWVSQAFIPLVLKIERQVLSAIHREFDNLFSKWFDHLVEDPSIAAQLQEDFSPQVSQDGYDNDIFHLSGGEKTSVALAYRLALNVVINNFMKDIKTHDLLILDEPTDGFSDEQLDRVRDVLQEFTCRQIIIVSHEQKMESFADQVINVSKHDGVSQI